MKSAPTYLDYTRKTTQTLWSSPSPNIFVNPTLYKVVNDVVLPESGLSVSRFWSELDAILTEFAPENRRLLEKRDHLQAQIDNYHNTHSSIEPKHYKAFLESIGYLLPQPDSVTVTTTNVDHEIASTAGPQLVVPVDNARYALNAANARWVSAYELTVTSLKLMLR